MGESAGVRYHYMDSMRAAMMVAGVFFHAALVYRPAGYSWRVTDPSDLGFFVWLTESLHWFRMPAFFAVAGFFCAMTFGRDAGVRKLGSRLLVFGVPFAVMVCSLQALQYAFKLDFQGSFAGFDASFWRAYFRDGEFISHLWFLINLSIYYVAAWACVTLLRQRDYLRARVVTYAFRYKTAMTLVATVCCLPAIVLLRPLTIGDYGLSAAVQYAPFFVAGYAIFRHAHLLEEFRRPGVVDIALTVALVALSYGDFTGPVGKIIDLLAFYQGGFVLTGLCMLLFSSFFNSENRLTRLISDSAYTIYLLHHILVVMFATWAARNLPEASAALKYSMVVGIVLAITFAAHHLLVARVSLARFLLNGRASFKLPRFLSPARQSA